MWLLSLFCHNCHSMQDNRCCHIRKLSYTVPLYLWWLWDLCKIFLFVLLQHMRCLGFQILGIKNPHRISPMRSKDNYCFFRWLRLCVFPQYHYTTFYRSFKVHYGPTFKKHKKFRKNLRNTIFVRPDVHSIIISLFRVPSSTIRYHFYRSDNCSLIMYNFTILLYHNFRFHQVSKGIIWYQLSKFSCFLIVL